MPYFEPAPDRPISSEMIRQGFAPSADEALEICHLDGTASGTDSTIALATAAIAVACSAGILGLSGLTLPILLPLGALGFGAVTAWNSRVTQRKRESEAEFLEEHGGILDLAEQKLTQGQPAHKVAAAIESALRAYNYGETPALPIGAASPPAAAQTPQAESQIGTETRLGAIAVEASNAVPAKLPADPTPSAPPVQPTGPTLIGTLQRAYQSRAIYGGQRSGKSLAAAAASRQMAQRGVNIFHINLASYRDETGHSEDDHYWTHCKRSTHADLSTLSAFEAIAKIAEAESILQEFYQTEFSVLIFDEVTLTGANFNQYSQDLETLMATLADKISTLGSTGEKRKRAIWTIAPDCVAGNLTQQTKIIKSLPGVYVAIAPGRTVEVNGGIYSFHAESFTAVQRNYPAMIQPSGSYGCDRIAFADGQWMPIGDLSFMLNAPEKKPKCSTAKAIDEMSTEAELTDARNILREAIALQTLQGRAK